ncbi:MAG: HAD family hydrolase [Anaerolineales bacterium]|nr:HAD family hydrolase [Anaerolineales bacterium]MCB9127334.1 HAD family hydrolase [Ardenticatenales bacterium]
MALDPERIDAIVFDLDGTLMQLRGGQKGGGLARWLAPLAPVLPDRDPQALARRLFVLSETPTNYLLAIMDRTGLMTLLRPWVDRGRAAKGIGTLGDLHPIDGVPALLARLQPRYALGVLTNRARREAYGFLDDNGLRDYFSAVTTRQDIWRFKPHPEAVRRTARLLQIPPERVLMVGDMPVDMESGKRAGAQALGVLTGFATAAELRAAGADVVLDSVAEMEALLPERLGVQSVNPYTDFLRSMQDAAHVEEIERFVAAWDVVETVMVAVSKRGRATAAERHAHAAARESLLAAYEPRWAERFAPHWPDTLEAGQPTASDPFARILAPDSADDFAGRWPLMQALAAARETLNRYILALTAPSNG